jgi:hypothetical protein
MSELRSAIGAMRADDVTGLPDARLEDDLREIRRAVDELEVEALRRIAVLDRRRVHAHDGHLSTASWLADRIGMSWGTARRDVRTARALERMPVTRQALAAGDLPLAAARRLVEAHRAEPVAFERDERTLVDAARRHDVRDLERVVRSWHERVSRDDPDRFLHERRGLHVSRTFMGAVRLDGTFDPEAGEVILAAVSSIVDAEIRSSDDRRSGGDDRRTPAQRRADALTELCRSWLDRPDRPPIGGERPHVNVTVDLDALTKGPGDQRSRDRVERSTAELDRVGPVSVDTARRLACDASVVRIVLGAPSQPLDVGRQTAVVPAALRRAVIVRDGGCRFPGCDRPHDWCDAHHVVHWADGGPTALANLLLLCRRHHRLVHTRGGFGLALEDGRPTFRRPDGTAIDDRAPP